MSKGSELVSFGNCSNSNHLQMHQWYQQVISMYVIDFFYKVCVCVSEWERERENYIVVHLLG